MPIASAARRLAQRLFESAPGAIHRPMIVFEGVLDCCVHGVVDVPNGVGGRATALRNFEAGCGIHDLGLERVEIEPVLDLEIYERVLECCVGHDGGLREGDRTPEGEGAVGPLS